jgi:hypothetical protein
MRKRRRTRTRTRRNAHGVDVWVVRSSGAIKRHVVELETRRLCAHIAVNLIV